MCKYVPEVNLYNISLTTIFFVCTRHTVARIRGMWQCTRSHMLKNLQDCLKCFLYYSSPLTENFDCIHLKLDNDLNL